jgi:hypothetical protein
MRWFIEVSSGNPTGPAEQWVVEAPQWQPALQAARALRGESIETAGFSIELLEDGFRVIDPATLVRYVVRRAPDGTPVSTPDAPTSSASSAVASGPRTPSTAPRAVSGTPPSASAPAADMAGMSQAERIAAMLSVDPTPHASSRAPSAASKSAAPKNASRPPAASSGRNGGPASRSSGPPEAAPSSPSAAVLRAPQGAVLRAPRAAAVGVPEPARPLSSAPPAAVSELPLIEAPAIEPVRPAQPVSAEPEPGPSVAQPPPPRLITQAPAAPVVQSLTELQALVHPSAPPRPVSQPPPAPVAQSSQPPVTVHAPQPHWPDRSAPATMHPPSSSPPESLPLAELLFQRSEEPSATSPLTYREAAWAVPEGTSIAAAVRLLAGMFEGVRAALAGVKPGKLVYMAIFDHHFVGKPTRPPLATLTWKDWKDQGQGPEIRRQGEPRTSFQPPPMSNSFIPAAVPQPLAAMVPVQATLPSAASAPPPPPVPAAASAVAPAAVPSIIIAPEAAPAPAAPAMTGPTPADVTFHVPPPPPPLTAPPEQPMPAAAPQDVMAATMAASPVLSPPLEALPSGPPLAVAPALPAEPPAPASKKLVIVPEAVTPQPVTAPAEAPRAPAPSAPSVRLSGVELIADLFECMHDLHFLPDALAGADFVLSLMLDKLPSAVVLIHFYDIDAREFVVVRAVGVGAGKVMQLRTNEKEPLIAEAMRKRRAVVLDDATADQRVQNGRWALIGEPPRSLVCAPVELGGRFLGLIELSNPLDGQPFREGDGHAITYIGEQFAEFLAARGIVVDPERIGD